jgi:hypothetical protein
MDLRATTRRIERCVIDVEDLVKRSVRREVWRSIREVALKWKEQCDKAEVDMDGLKFADFYFLTERLRKKSRLGLMPGLVAPMVNLYFVAYSFCLRGEEARKALIQKEFVRDFDRRWGEQSFISIDRTIHSEQRENGEDPLLLLELCEDSPLVRDIWGRGWRRYVMRLSERTPSRASWLIRMVIAVNSIARHFESLCQKGQHRPARAWVPRLGGSIGRRWRMGA